MSTSPARPLILVVDVDLQAARGLARMLVDDGFEVERAVDGAAAIARLSAGPLPDAIITDVFLPQVDGLTVARFARSKNPKMPAVVVTGHVELMSPATAPLVPAPIVLGKPLDYDELTRALRALLPTAA